MERFPFHAVVHLIVTAWLASYLMDGNEPDVEGEMNRYAPSERAMHQHTTSFQLPCSVADVFDFLARPTNLLKLAPPEMRLQLVEGPVRLALGARMHWKARRLGVSHMLVNEVTAFEENARIDEEQRQGPFRKWTFSHCFQACGDGTRLTEEVVYEPPGGMLGLLVGAATIRMELEKLFAYRAQRLGELLGT
jgi:ligand-binding SRPBCC domain-containing protein